MINVEINFSKVKVEVLSRVNDLSTFDCGDKDINDFLQNDAIIYQEKKIATTIIFILNEKIIGFFSTAADSIRLKLEEKEVHKIEGKPFQEFPAIKIARIGRDVRFKNQPVGTKILKWAIGYVIRCSEMTAVRLITVDSYPNRVQWYEKIGFKRNLDKRYTKKDQHVSMRFDLCN